MKLPIRRRASPSKGRAPQRASAGLSAVRAVAALALLAISGALYGLTVRDEFRLDPDRLSVEGAVYTGADAVSSTLGLGDGARPNIFRIRTVELAAALRQLPAVLDAEVGMILPDRMSVRLHERTPIVIWQWHEVRLLADVEGVLFARLPAGAQAPAGLPTVTDRRERPSPPAEGEHVDSVDFDAVRLLAAVTPQLLGSSAISLDLSLDDVEGFTLDAQPRLWHAVFGFYTPQLRSPDLIPGQVQCLGALIAPSETTLDTVILSPADGRCGTFRVHGGPSPSARPSGGVPTSPGAPSPSSAPSSAPSAEPSAEPSSAPSPTSAPAGWDGTPRLPVAGGLTGSSGVG